MAHAHARDDRLHFDEEPHLYMLDERVPCISVTKLVEETFPIFDADQQIALMKARGTWASSRYALMNEEEVKDMWQEHKERSADHGTRMHALVERFFSPRPKETAWSAEERCLPEMKEFLHWYRQAQKNAPAPLQCYRSEWRIFDEEYAVAGTLDALFQVPSTHQDGKVCVHLYDWKFAREIHLSPRCAEDVATDVRLVHLSNCNFIHYALQLSFYRYLLEKHYDVHVTGMYLLHIRPDSRPDMWDAREKRARTPFPPHAVGTRHRLCEVAYLKEEVLYLLKKHAQKDNDVSTASLLREKE